MISAPCASATPGCSRRCPARDGSRLPMALERARRDQPPPPPLHARSLQPVAEQAGWKQSHHLLQLAAAARGDPAAGPGALNTKTTESSLDLWVPPAPVNWCSSGRSRSRRTCRSRRARTGRPLVAGRLQIALSSRPRRRPRHAGGPAHGVSRCRRASRKVQARLAKNVLTVTTAVANAWASSLSRWRHGRARRAAPR